MFRPGLLVISVTPLDYISYRLFSVRPSLTKAHPSVGVRGARAHCVSLRSIPCRLQAPGGGHRSNSLVVVQQARRGADSVHVASIMRVRCWVADHVLSWGREDELAGDEPIWDERTCTTPPPYSRAGMATCTKPSQNTSGPDRLKRHSPQRRVDTMVYEWQPRPAFVLCSRDPGQPCPLAGSSPLRYTPSCGFARLIILLTYFPVSSAHPSPFPHATRRSCKTLTCNQQRTQPWRRALI